METKLTYEPAKKANLKAHVAELTNSGSRHESNSAGVTAALAYLKKCLSGYGYTVHEEPYGTAAHEVNLWCELAGSHAAPVLEIGAHWDTVKDCRGADDNASGVAGVLELARVLREDQKLAPQLRRTVRFCLFGGEEDQPDLCTGSRYHVDRLKPAPDGIIVLEMIAYRDNQPGSQSLPAGLDKDPALSKLTTGTFIAAIGISDASDYLNALESAGRTYSLPVVKIPLPPNDYTASDFARSDHFPYWKKNWKGVMVTDTANFRNPNYHKPSDTIDTLDFDFAEQVTAAVADAVRNLAK